MRTGVSSKAMRGKVIKNFNYPPSQYQLHVQWLVPPLFPFQHHMAEQPNHLHEGRAFPLTYLRAMLSLNIPYQVEKDTPIEEIVAFYDSRGVKYKKMWTEFYEKAIADSVESAKWPPHDFEYEVEDKKVYGLCSNSGSLNYLSSLSLADMLDSASWQRVRSWRVSTLPKCRTRIASQAIQGRQADWVLHQECAEAFCWARLLWGTARRLREARPLLHEAYSDDAVERRCPDVANTVPGGLQGKVRDDPELCRPVRGDSI